MKVIILENIRSAYNVGNIIRTADALGWDVWLTWYSPSPLTNNKVKKTSLGAENTVHIRQFWFTSEAIEEAKKLGCEVLAAEITPTSVSLEIFSLSAPSAAIIFGNEVDGVLSETLVLVDRVVAIPMQGTKESLNVGQSSAILMWQIGVLLQKK